MKVHFLLLFSIIFLLSKVVDSKLMKKLKRTDQETDTNKYISKITFVITGSKNEGINLLEKEGYHPVEFDLKRGSMFSKYVYLGYKTTQNRDEAISDLIAQYSGDEDLKKEITYNKKQYFAVSCLNKDTHDISKGSGGKYIFLYYTNTGNQDFAINDLAVSDSKDYLNDFNKYYTVQWANQKGDRADFNKGKMFSDGNYLHYKGDLKGQEKKEEYISEVFFTREEKPKDIANDMKKKGYKMIFYDLREGGSANVYLGFKTTTNKTDAVTDLVGMFSDLDLPNDLKKNNVYYPAIKCLNCESDFYDIYKGVAGFVTIYQIKDNQNGKAIEDIIVNNSEVGLDGYKTMKWENIDSPARLSNEKSVNAPYVYIHYK